MYRQFDPASQHPMHVWTVVTTDDRTVLVETNGNGGFGPVNIWTGTEWLAVKYRDRYTVCMRKDDRAYWTARLARMLAQREGDAEDARLRSFRVYGHPGFTRTTIDYRKR